MADLLKPWLLAALFLATGGLAAQPDAGGEDAPPPEQVVARLESMLIEHMKAGDAMTFDERFERLRPLLEDILAVERMGRYLFGRDWADFEAERQQRFLDAFLDLSAATYAGQFKAYDGERFDAVGVDRQQQDRAVVRRKLTTGSGREVSFDYLMTPEEDGWRIVTIITDGVSDLAVKRSQYRRILDQDGFEALIDHIRDGIESQRSG